MNLEVEREDVERSKTVDLVGRVEVERGGRVEGEMGEAEREDTPDPEVSQASLAVNFGHLCVCLFFRTIPALRNVTVSLDRIHHSWHELINIDLIKNLNGFTFLKGHLCFDILTWFPSC